MRRRNRFLSFWSPVLLGLGAATACTNDVIIPKVSPPTTTLGEDIYSVLCDRVGASVFTEDLTGASYRGVCHKEGTTFPSMTVDSTQLPPVTPGTPAAQARTLSIAKVEAMARHRSDLVAAFDATFPDTKIDDPQAPGDTTRQVRLHDALTQMTQRLVPLYTSNPLTPTGAPLIPTSTRAIAGLFDTLRQDSSALQHLAQIGTRAGYRPLPISLGAVRTLLEYPELRSFVQIALDRFGPGGALQPQFQKLLTVAQNELALLQPDPAQPFLSVNGATAQPNRPRDLVELLSSMLLLQNDAFTTDSEARYIAARDPRGFALTVGAMPGMAGTVQAPFLDMNGDGLADVDSLGRYLGVNGMPFNAPPPFQAPDILFDSGYTFDMTFGQAQQNGMPLYQYLNTSRTLLNHMTLDLQPVVATQGSSSMPLPSTLMKLLGGAYDLCRYSIFR